MEKALLAILLTKENEFFYVSKKIIIYQKMIFLYCTLPYEKRI